MSAVRRTRKPCLRRRPTRLFRPAPEVSATRGGSRAQSPCSQGGTRAHRHRGPGVFLAGEVVKQGGGPAVVRQPGHRRPERREHVYDAAELGTHRTQPVRRPLLGSAAGLENLTFGWPTPLVFVRSLKVSVVVRQDGVVQILANVVVGAP